MVLCYVCISLLMQTRNDFRFIIPYVEFAKEVKGLKPYILDTSVVIDGRIADVVETKLFDSQLIMPRFVLAELQNIADSSDRMRRSRGRRGLDVLNKLRANTNVDLQMYDRELPEFANHPVDLKLVMLAKHLDGKIITNDYNLNKVAQVQGVDVINLNDLANALKPVFLPGEHLDVRIVKPGEEAGPGRRLPGRRHDDRRRRGSRASEQNGQRRRHQRAANQRRPDDLWPLRCPRQGRFVISAADGWRMTGPAPRRASFPSPRSQSTRPSGAFPPLLGILVRKAGPRICPANGPRRSAVSWRSIRGSCVTPPDCELWF